MVVNTDENIFLYHSHGPATTNVVRGNTFAASLQIRLGQIEGMGIK
jgi:hypothetical protein